MKKKNILTIVLISLFTLQILAMSNSVSIISNIEPEPVNAAQCDPELGCGGPKPPPPEEPPANKAPTATVYSPSANQMIESLSFTISGNGKDLDGTVTALYFYLDNSFIKSYSTSASSVTETFTHTVNIETFNPGAHTIKVKAKDNRGATGESSKTFYFFADPFPPTVSIVLPTANQQFAPNQGFTFEASASDNDRVNYVDFYVNDVLKWSDPSAPYYYSESLSQLGSYTLKAKAYDDYGKSAIATRSISVVNPTVSIISPNNNADVSDIVMIQATASGAAGINRVHFFIDGVLKDTVTSPPYEYEWDATRESETSHKIEVIAYDNLNNYQNDLIYINVLTPIHLNSIEPILEFDKGSSINLNLKFQNYGSEKTFYYRLRIRPVNIDGWKENKGFWFIQRGTTSISAGTVTNPSYTNTNFGFDPFYRTMSKSTPVFNNGQPIINNVPDPAYVSFNIGTYYVTEIYVWYGSYVDDQTGYVTSLTDQSKSNFIITPPTGPEKHWVYVLNIYNSEWDSNHGWYLADNIGTFATGYNLVVGDRSDSSNQDSYSGGFKQLMNIDFRFATRLQAYSQNFGTNGDFLNRLGDTYAMNSIYLDQPWKNHTTGLYSNYGFDLLVGLDGRKNSTGYNLGGQAIGGNMLVLKGEGKFQGSYKWWALAWLHEFIHQYGVPDDNNFPTGSTHPNGYVMKNGDTSDSNSDPWYIYRSTDSETTGKAYGNFDSYWNNLYQNERLWERTHTASIDDSMSANQYSKTHQILLIDRPTEESLNSNILDVSFSRPYSSQVLTFEIYSPASVTIHVESISAWQRTFWYPIPIDTYGYGYYTFVVTKTGNQVENYKIDIIQKVEVIKTATIDTTWESTGLFGSVNIFLQLLDRADSKTSALRYKVDWSATTGLGLYAYDSRTYLSFFKLPLTKGGWTNQNLYFRGEYKFRIHNSDDSPDIPLTMTFEYTFSHLIKVLN